MFVMTEAPKRPKETLEDPRQREQESSPAGNWTDIFFQEDGKQTKVYSPEPGQPARFINGRGAFFMLQVNGL